MEITLSELEEVLDKRFGDFGQVIDKKFVRFGQEMDKKLSHFVTRDELGTILDEKLADVVTEMKTFTEEQVENLALDIQETIAIPLQELKQHHKIAA